MFQILLHNLVWHGMHLFIKDLQPMCLYNFVVCARNLHTEILISMNIEHIDKYSQIFNTLIKCGF